MLASDSCKQALDLVRMRSWRSSARAAWARCGGRATRASAARSPSSCCPTCSRGDRERVTRFQREAQLLAALNHPNIASIYSFETVDGIRVLEMELVPGETIRDLLHAGPLPLARALDLAHDVADALGVAHGKGILHRDLKPANVKVTPDGKVKLLDFGLAKAFVTGIRWLGRLGVPHPRRPALR